MAIRKKIKNIFNDPALIMHYIRHYKRNALYKLLNTDYKLFKNHSFYPRILTLTLFNGCNCRCKMCDIGQSLLNKDRNDRLISKNVLSDDPMLALEDWKKLINESVKYKPDISFSGTEPLLSPFVLDLAKYIVKKGLNLHITTNAFFLEKYAKEFVKMANKNFNLGISLDGLFEKHDEIRGVPGIFNKALNALRIIDEEKKRLNKEDPAIYITTAITPYNYKNIVEFYNYFNENFPKTIKNIMFSHYFFKDNTVRDAHNKFYGDIYSIPSSNDDENIKNMDPQIIINQKNALAGLKNKNISYSFMPELKDESIIDYYKNSLKLVTEANKCVAFWRDASINPNGDVIVQAMCFGGKLGNIREKSLKKIWNGPEIKKLRDFIRKHKTTPACTRCCLLFRPYNLN